MSKARKVPQLSSRLRVKSEDKSLPKLFDAIALIAVGVAIIALLALFVMYEQINDLIARGANNMLDPAYPVVHPLYLALQYNMRAPFSLMLYCLVTFGVSYGTGRLMKEQEHLQVKYFKTWFAAELVLVVLLILSLGLFY
nr:hypothetical protein [Candidatus Sigynarchaeota archaeon]